MSAIEFPTAAGFATATIGTHTGKTMMLAELRALLHAVPGPAKFEDYRVAVVEDNALSKSTDSNRRNTLKYLKQLYALQPDVPVFVAMRELWFASDASQPLLALLCASARDVLLRTTASVVADAEVGSLIRASDVALPIRLAFPDRYSANTMRNLGQNIASSWTQAGFLAGAKDKRRSRPVVQYPAVVYALYLGHLEGAAGPALFTTPWTRLLDSDETTVRTHAEAAARQGWLEYRSSGGMTELTFRHLDELTGWQGT